MFRKGMQEDSLQVIPLGGVGEIGKNMFVLKYNDEIVVLDAGLKFPEIGMLGVDIVIPDISYLLEHRDQIKAIILTHGHEDHIGAVPYLIDDLPVPIYGTRLTLGLLEAKLMEFDCLHQAELYEIDVERVLSLSENLKLEFFRTNHSIPDSVGVAVDTPAGLAVYTSDYKFDQTPVDGKITDFHKLIDYGNRGVLVALSDCTNAERPGYTQSEKEVGSTIDEVFRLARGRIIFATFASNIHRIQQVVSAADHYRRKICVIGRSVVNSVEIASKLGYLEIPPGMLVEIDQIDRIPDHELVLVTTGSQGEPMSALTRISLSEHRRVEIVPGDTVIIAATPIPGNEVLVSRTVDNLFRRGAEVIYRPISGVHVSGHGSEEELKLMLNLLKPTYLVPVHGEYRHQFYYTRIAEKVGIPKENVFRVEAGTVLEFSDGRGRIAGSVQAGNVLVDGLGVGDVGDVVLRDRQVLASEGIVVVVVTVDREAARIVAGPEIVSRGFVYVRESEELLEAARQNLTLKLNAMDRERLLDWNTFKAEVRNFAGSFFYEYTGRRPMILPIIMELPGEDAGSEPGD